jgi:hypothetical protein
MAMSICFTSFEHLQIKMVEIYERGIYTITTKSTYNMDKMYPSKEKSLALHLNRRHFGFNIVSHSYYMIAFCHRYDQCCFIC